MTHLGTESLCRTCYNQDMHYVRNGNAGYSPKLECDYRMSAYPNARTCRYYAQSEHDDGNHPQGGRTK